MTLPQSVFFRSGALRLHAARHAGQGGCPLVIVPGITTPAGAFAFVAGRLAAAVGDVYVLDMRGRGLSERAGSGAHRASDYADDVLALIEHAGLTRPVLVGHSLGARVVAAARARFPGCSAGMIAIDPPLSGPGRRPYPTGLDQFVNASGLPPVTSSPSSRAMRGSTWRRSSQCGVMWSRPRCCFSVIRAPW